jgi:hypothetical protein
MRTMRAMDLQDLRARVARAEYVVDEDAVAEVIVRRALERRGGAPGSAPPFSRAAERGARSPER